VTEGLITEPNEAVETTDALRTTNGDIVYSNQQWSIFDRKKIDIFAVKLQENGGFNLLAFNKTGGRKARAVLPTHPRRAETFDLYQKL